MNRWDTTGILDEIDSLTQAINRDPETPMNFLARGNAYCKLQQWDQALADYDQVLRLDPNNHHAHSNRGYVFYQRDEWHLAIEAFTASLQFGKTADVLVKCATAFGRLERRQEARNDLMQAMRMDPSDPIVFYAAGLYHQWDGNYHAAITNFDRCIENNPEDVPAYWHRAECYAKLTSYAEAIQSYREYIEKENPLVVKWINGAEQKICELEAELSK